MMTMTHPRRPPWRRFLWAGLLLATVIAVGLWRSQVQSWVLMQLLIRQQVPDEAALAEVVAAAPSPERRLRALWRTGRIPHRTFVLQHLRGHPELRAELDEILAEAARDEDLSARELARGQRAGGTNQLDLPPILAQLRDVDPEARFLALENLRDSRAPSSSILPAIFPLIEDSEPKVAALASIVLKAHTGYDPGLRLADVVLAEGAVALGADARAKLATAAQLWRRWRESNESRFPATTTAIPDDSATARRAPRMVDDFALPDLSGTVRRLSDYRGQVVLLNFWATWCLACVSEIPVLIQLQQELAGASGTSGGNAVILGIALDQASASGPHEHREGENHSHEHSGARSSEPLEPVRKKVAEFARRHQINYPLLLDPDFSVGGRFNGGELPTHALIDREGRLRRRFLGPRSHAVLAAMIQEIVDSSGAARP